MKNTILVAGVLAAAPAAAQPGVPEAPSPSTCALTIARAPDDVREIVERWVRAEPRCTTALEIRIVPTEGGLYLLARDEQGRVRERVVPDAQSAGVLVASWVAADASDAPTPYDVHQPHAPEPQLASEPPIVTDLLPQPAAVATPGDAGPGAGPIVIAKPAVARPAKWLALGGMFAMSGNGGGGVRGELDLKTRKSLTFGIAASFSTWGATFYDHGETLETLDGKALAYLAIGAKRGRWHLRGALGAGLVYTHATVQQWSSGGYYEAGGLFPVGELSAAVGREVTDRWQLYAGPIFSAYAQTYNLEQMMPGYDTRSQQSRGIEAMFILGMRHEL
jgi:hypothetical protein